MLATLVHGPDAMSAYSTHFFVAYGKKQSDADIRKTFASIFKQVVPSCPLGISEWRQLTHALLKFFHPKYFSEAFDNESPDEDHMPSHQAGHSNLTAERNYGLTTDDHWEMSSDMLARFFSYSRWWHTFLSDFKNDTATNPVFSMKV
jgi:hypothetical protein